VTIVRTASAKIDSVTSRSINRPSASSAFTFRDPQLFGAAAAAKFRGRRLTITAAFSGDFTAANF
jgi:hypothetical protein